MCSSMFSTPKVETPKVTEPDPVPTVTEEQVSTESNEQSRRSRINRLRAGLASTIKTSARGITGTGAELYSSSGRKTKLGA